MRQTISSRADTLGTPIRNAMRYQRTTPTTNGIRKAPLEHRVLLYALNATNMPRIKANQETHRAW